MRDVHDRYRSRDIQDRFLKAGFTGQSPEKEVFDTVLGKGRLGNVKWVSVLYTFFPNSISYMGTCSCF